MAGPADKFNNQGLSSGPARITILVEKHQCRAPSMRNLILSLFLIISPLAHGQVTVYEYDQGSARGYPDYRIHQKFDPAGMRALAQQLEVQRAQQEGWEALLSAQQHQMASKAAAMPPQFTQPRITQETFWDRFNTMASQRKGLYADWDSVVMRPDLAITEDMVSLMAESPYAADIAYYLGKNPELSERIARQGILDAARSILAIEGKVSAAQ